MLINRRGLITETNDLDFYDTISHIIKFLEIKVLLKNRKILILNIHNVLTYKCKNLSTMEF